MARTYPGHLDAETQAVKYLYNCLSKNKYFFTFEARAWPPEEQLGHLGFVKPYFAEFNPACPLGRPLNHTEDPRTLLPIPVLLRANCLDKDQYPWNILCSGSDGWQWDWQRQKLYEELNVAAYKAERYTLIDPTVPQSAMSTVTALAQQSSYP